MLFVSGKSPHLSITQSVYDFFIERYEIASDVWALSLEKT